MADDVDVIVSEIMFDTACPDGSTCLESEQTYEWVEIFNKGASVVDLTGWSICDESGCDAISGTINPGQFLVIAAAENSTELTPEFAQYGASVNPVATIFLNATIGSGGLSNSGDAVYLRTSDAGCGINSNNQCITDCLSWDSTNTCSVLIADPALGSGNAYLTSGDGYDDESLNSNIQQGQSIVNIQGIWYQAGPDTNTANQASPYLINIREGSVTAVSLQSFTGGSNTMPILILATILILLLGGTLFIWQRKRQ